MPDFSPTELAADLWIVAGLHRVSTRNRPMISFNSLLRAESIDPATVKLVRHQDKRISGRPTPYQLWKMPDGSFDEGSFRTWLKNVVQFAFGWVSQQSK